MQIPTTGDKFSDTVNNIGTVGQIASNVVASTVKGQTTYTITTPAGTMVAKPGAIVLSHPNASGQNVWIIGQ